MAPQGLGAALGMNRAGRLTDRVGGGPVVIAGLLALMLGTVAFTQVRPDTPYWVLEVSLFVRGIGLGFTMMPAMAAAYSTLERWQVPRATPMLNVVQRVGGSLGTAVLAVVLQRQLAHAGSRGPAPWRTASGTPTGGRWPSPPSRWSRRSCWRAPSARGRRPRPPDADRRLAAPGARCQASTRAASRCSLVSIERAAALKAPRSPARMAAARVK